jgi:fructose-bisphosphate aldolase/2-amino-3,7-dideoxy-D-threo-hept-6-ulosonate synthase
MDSVGKQLRLGRLFGEDDRVVVVAMDHGSFMGPARGWEDPTEAIKAVVRGGADAVMTTFGVAQRHYKLLKGRTSLILSTPLSQPEMVNTVRAASSLGADALKIFVTVTGGDDSASLNNLWSASLVCAEYGMPLLAEMYPVKGEKIPEPTSKDVVAKYARIGAEYGADIIKTFYTGDAASFSEVTKSSLAPVLILGGNKTETDLELLNTVDSAMRAGGGGVAIGRNVWQHADPERITRSIVRVVHEGYAPEDSLKS